MDIIYNGLGEYEIDDICKELKVIARKVSVINSKIELSLGQYSSTYMKPSLNIVSGKLSYLTTQIYNIKPDYKQGN